MQSTWQSVLLCDNIWHVSPSTENVSVKNKFCCSNNGLMVPIDPSNFVCVFENSHQSIDELWQEERRKNSFLHTSIRWFFQYDSQAVWKWCMRVTLKVTRALRGGCVLDQNFWIWTFSFLFVAERKHHQRLDFTAEWWKVSNTSLRFFFYNLSTSIILCCLLAMKFIGWSVGELRFFTKILYVYGHHYC